MKQRIITAIVLAIIAIPVCIFSGSVLFPILWAFLGVVGVWELLGCMGTRNRLAISIPLIQILFLCIFASSSFYARCFNFLHFRCWIYFKYPIHIIWLYSDM